jgi:hypothetical protein
VKPGDEAGVAGDDDRDQQPHVANAANQSVDVTERTHSFADSDRVYSDALDTLCLHGVRHRSIRWRFSAQSKTPVTPVRCLMLTPGRFRGLTSMSR